ncbi:MAG: hypothetical protein RPR40_10200 [Bermanella sp.]
MAALAVIDGLDPSTGSKAIKRLSGGVAMVREVMAAGAWLTHFQIQRQVANLPAGKHFSESGISARVRDQRKAKNGAHIVNRRIRPGTTHLFEYQLVLNTPGGAQ